MDGSENEDEHDDEEIEDETRPKLGFFEEILEKKDGNLDARRPPDFSSAAVWYDGGGVNGGRDAAESACFGVPGCDSHRNGIEPFEESP